MKLIIDIDENVFTRLFDAGDTSLAWTSDIKNMQIAIRKGTPLEKIRAEITKDLENTQNDYDDLGERTDLGTILGLEMALETIDKHTKGGGK